MQEIFKSGVELLLPQELVRLVSVREGYVSIVRGHDCCRRVYWNRTLCHLETERGIVTVLIFIVCNEKWAPDITFST